MKHRSLKKRLLALAATVLTLVMCMAGTMSASAANTPATGTTTSFNKYLVMDAEANVPNVEFSFSITAGAAVPASDGNPAIYAGNDTSHVNGTPTVGSAAFKVGDSITNGLPTDSNAEGKKYATKEVTVDFSGVTFSAPGIYRYIITESASSQDGIANDTTTTRTLDVYVRYQSESESQLEVAGYVMYNGTVTGNTDLNDSDTKSTSYTNNYNTSNLTLEKQVTGNQGDRDKYFEFTVNITDAVAGTVYAVVRPAQDNDSRNPSTITATNGTATATFYLKDNQSIVIQGLTSGTKYTITETNYADDGYTTSYVLTKVGSEPITGNNISTSEQTMGDANNTVTFTNTKNGTVPTGILLETAPYIVLGALVLAGFVVLFATRRRRSR